MLAVLISRPAERAVDKKDNRRNSWDGLFKRGRLTLNGTDWVPNINAKTYVSPRKWQPLRPFATGSQAVPVQLTFRPQEPPP